VCGEYRSFHTAKTRSKPRTIGHALLDFARQYLPGQGYAPKLAILISLSIIAGYWLLALALGLVGIRHLCLRSSHSRRIGALFLAGSCGFVVASIYAPEINAWLFFRNVSPPRAMVILSRSLDVDSIAANFATTGSFDVFVTSPSFTVTYGVLLQPVVIEQTTECEAGGTQAALPNAIPRACIYRKDAITPPPCRLEITFEGSPPFNRTARTNRMDLYYEDGEWRS
jgi:hypothetical protein